MFDSVVSGAWWWIARPAIPGLKYLASLPQAMELISFPVR